jgi:hypothetical protein
MESTGPNATACVPDSSCAQPQVASWTGTSGTEFNASGAGWEDHAEVTWTLASSDGCVDHYTPSGTATYRIGAHYCIESDPVSAPIEPGDGELVIDRSTSPATYTMNGVSEWSGYFGCRDPEDPTGWNPATLRSRWATDYHGAFELDVFGGGEGNPGDVGHTNHWAFTDAGASFPPPVAGVCSEPASDLWDTVTTYATATATITWTRDSTTGCKDHYAPSGTMVRAPILDEDPSAFCRERRWEPASGPVAPEDGSLVIDRSVNPPTFRIQGSSSWAATETCTRPDDTVETATVSAGGSWAERWNGPFHGDEFAGGFGAGGGASDWSFARP